MPRGPTVHNDQPLADTCQRDQFLNAHWPAACDQGEYHSERQAGSSLAPRRDATLGRRPPVASNTVAEYCVILGFAPHDHGRYGDHGRHGSGSETPRRSRVVLAFLGGILFGLALGFIATKFGVRWKRHGSNNYPVALHDSSQPR
jgi:hypothetical protein